ncbi:MAG TPA: M1 family metallopeptidase [Thermoanaerobaculia bacterium]|nr:M1 family metallopeptidase [Thermoanaerobaculia bacterium]
MRAAILFLATILLTPGLRADDVPPSPAAPVPPKLRLPATARPTKELVDLTIIPSETTFRGVVDVDVVLKEPTSLLWLHGTGLTVTDATLTAAGKTMRASAVPGGKAFIGFALPETVPPGQAKLHVAYGGPISSLETSGLFRQKDGADWYVFSQFEAIDARRAFPCFDEPAFKIPWKLTLHVKKEHLAVSNTPALAETDESNGMKAVAFAETKPLPSYLVALGVGPFEVVPAGTAGSRKVPVRIIVPRGRSAEARYAAATTAPILSVLEEWFGIAYPYEKLDNLAIPQTVGFGAMENPGLITYASAAMLRRPEDESATFARRYAAVCAHENAHQWFGDLVTMVYWDDIWLNEGFATWMSRKTLDKWKPEWDTATSRIAARSDVMDADALVSARRVRQPIEGDDDIANAFDGITYQKGAALLSMFESWIGEEKFRKGIQRYLKAHAFGNATSRDLFEALSAESETDVVSAFSTFLDQPGVPLVTVEVKCPPGAPPHLVLAQRRFVPEGGSGAVKELWRIPVCVRYQAGAILGRACVLLKDEVQEVVLGTEPACPEWLLANDGEAGYYRTLYRGDLFAKVLGPARGKLSAAERAGALENAAALAESGDLSRADALALVPAYANDANRNVVASAARIAASISRHLVPDALRANYARFLETTFGERARALGLTARPDDDDDTRLLRTTVVPLVAEEAEDPQLDGEAARLARRWLVDRKAVDPDNVEMVLRLAARSGGRELFERLKTAARKTEDRRERREILAALGSFRDRTITREAMNLVFSDEFDVRESINVVLAALGHRATRELVYEFVENDFDLLAERLPRDYPARLPMVAAVFCDEERRAKAEAFFKPRIGAFTGGPRLLAQALEKVSLCAAQQKAQQASVVEFLKRYSEPTQKPGM